MLAWDVDRLIDLTAHLPRKEVRLDSIRELDEPFWFGGGETPTCRAADPEHRRTQVEEGGRDEPQYVAELLGLHRVGSDLGRGHGVTAADLARIREVRSEEVEDTDGYTVRGTAVLDDGSTLDVQALVVRRGADFRLTGAVG